MKDEYAITGPLTDATTVKLDEPLEEYLANLRARQAARGHVPRTREEIDAQVRA
jgi:hypothetical protein